MQKKYYSIIDIGSNTMRLVIYERENSGRLQEIENVKSVARLKNHITTDNRLSDEGISRLLSVLKSFKEVIRTHNLTDFICVGTAALRQAQNRVDIWKIVKEEIGWDMRILSEKEEAYYGYLSVVNSTTVTEGITVDIGGGSTEITYFKDRILQHSHSFPFGALTLKSFFKRNKPSDKEFMKLHNYLSEQFGKLDWIKKKRVPLIGIGGSARNMAQIDQNSKKYPLAGLHQYEMHDNDIAKISNYLSSLPSDELEKVEGLSKDRADTILPAIEVFYALYQTIQAKNFILSRKGLRDGIFYEKLSPGEDNNLYEDVLKDSFDELMYEYNMDREQVAHVQSLAKKLLTELQDKGIGNLTSMDWKLLKQACSVYNLGEYIDSESSAQHTFYLLANRTIDGLMHIDRLKLALIASYKNKTIFKQFIHPYKHWFLKPERKKLPRLGAILKFCYAMDTTKRRVIDDFKLEMKTDTVTLTFYCNKDFRPEQYQISKQKKHLGKALHKDIDIFFIRKQ